MCGKFTQAKRFKEMAGIAEQLLETVTPMRFAQVIALDGQGLRRTVAMRWGLPSASTLHIHARAETIDGKPRFRDSFAAHRGLIMATTFNEGEEVTPTKTQQYVLTPTDGNPVAIAAIWELGDPLSFAMVTTQANALISTITDRMPALIAEEDWAKWLGETPATIEELKAILRPSDRELKMERAGKPPSPKHRDQAELF